MRKRKTKRIRKNPYVKLLEKIDHIRKRVPSIEPTGKQEDPETKETLFHYTEAQSVFDTYRTECEREKLIYRPYAAPGIVPILLAVGGMPLIALPFCIEDLETGAVLVGYGCGMGANRDWSGNTAHTRALKQFLLTTFQATWKDPELTDVLGIADTAEEVKTQLGDFFMKTIKAGGQIPVSHTPKKQKVTAKRIQKKGRKK